MASTAAIRQQIARLQRQADEVDVMEELAACLPHAKAELGEAEDDAASFAAAALQAEEAASALRAECAEARRRLDVCQSATSAPDLTTRIEARTVRLACEEEISALQAPLAQAEALAAGCAREAAAAENRVKRAEHELTRISEAMGDPLGHERGRQTRAWMGRDQPVLSVLGLLLRKPELGMTQEETDEHAVARMWLRLFLETPQAVADIRHDMGLAAENAVTGFMARQALKAREEHKLLGIEEQAASARAQAAADLGMLRGEPQPGVQAEPAQVAPPLLWRT
jgi:hypothetical protein